MEDLRKRILFYGFAVLLTLSLLVATAVTFWRKHDTIRQGLREWIECELTNEFTPDEYGLDQDCDALRDDEHRISPFWFTTWTISCFLAILGQIILSFHAKARKRAKLFKQKTFDKLADTMQLSPRPQGAAKNQTNKMAPLSLNDNDTNDVDVESPATEQASRSTLTVSRSSGKGLVEIPSISNSKSPHSPEPLQQIKSSSVEIDD
eukprot:CAMPEP_0197077756 /NCGR_PEP_ID=MMETSP1384-20130603/212779_1 /TAXON_ID=29189 /ORGANISM="Ammonia sp." /LENGTH=205 /DNA_ID=CAMNT_0042516621 /DNA_START=746 /DNA_END=1363 /DNA_ORIENTATION=-